MDHDYVNDVFVGFIIQIISQDSIFLCFVISLA